VLCRSEEELYENLDVRDAPFYDDFYKEFCDFHDGYSADRVIEYCIEKSKVPLKSKVDKFIKKAYKKILK
jgi:hypothetical protein